jgi:hypothetical protein
MASSGEHHHVALHIPARAARSIAGAVSAGAGHLASAFLHRGSAAAAAAGSGSSLPASYQPGEAAAAGGETYSAGRQLGAPSKGLLALARMSSARSSSSRRRLVEADVAHVLEAVQHGECGAHRYACALPKETARQLYYRTHIVLAAFIAAFVHSLLGGRQADSVAPACTPAWHTCGAGAVYYIGNVHVRPAQQVNVVRRLLINNVFRGLLLLAHADMEEWQLPYDQVVELGLIMFV